MGELADSGQELTDYTTDSTAVSAKVGVWITVAASLMKYLILGICKIKYIYVKFFYISLCKGNSS